MNHYEVLTLLISVIGVILIPFLVVSVKGISKWTRIEDKLDSLAGTDKSILDKIDKNQRDTDAKLRNVEKRLQWLVDKVWTLWRRDGNT